MERFLEEDKLALVKAKDDMARYYNQLWTPAPEYHTGDNSDADPDLYKDDPQHASLHLYHHLITQPTLVPCHI